MAAPPPRVKPPIFMKVMNRSLLRDCIFLWGCLTARNLELLSWVALQEIWNFFLGLLRKKFDGFARNCLGLEIDIKEIIVEHKISEYFLGLLRKKFGTSFLGCFARNLMASPEIVLD